MQSIIKTLSIALIASAAVAQQETNAPLTESQPSSLTVTGRTDEERIKFLLEVASVYTKEKDYASAINAYERILEIDPMNKEARYISGHVYINAKQYAEAEQTMLLLIEENPDDFQLKNNLAWLYATAEDPAFRDGQKAIDLAQQAMILAPNDHHVWSTLSEAYYTTGQYDKAYRAIKHMANLASRYGQNITKDMVESYNEQIRKCKRALDAEEVLKGDEELSSTNSLSVDENAQ